MTQILSGVPETLLIPLWARASETREEKPIIRDEHAVELVKKIDYEFAKFEGSWMTQTGVAVRTEILDREARKFIGSHPDAVIINIGCGLDTRYFRLDNGRIRWIDLDLPEPITIRKNFFKETQRYRMLGKSVFDYSWIEDIERGSTDDLKTDQVLFIAEGVLMYFTEQQIRELMKTLSARFPTAQMLFEMMPTMIVNSAGKHETVKKTNARFHWGLRRGKDMEQVNPRIRFLEEWNYFDYHRDRWRWMRWLSLIPMFHNNVNNRIVHIVFQGDQAERIVL